MAEGYKDSEVTWVSWSKGSHCAARSEDGKWYRARIINVIQKNTIEVKVYSSSIGKRPLVLGFRGIDTNRWGEVYCGHVVEHQTPIKGSRVQISRAKLFP